MGIAWPWLLIPGALLLVTRLYSMATIPGAAEDAYITFRYAANWAQGLGPVYNAGERVWGFSSPLWTGMLALAAKLGVDLPATSRVVAGALDMVSLLVGMRLISTAAPSAAWAYGLFWALHPYTAAMAASGMETSLFWCLAVLAAADLRGNPWRLGVLIGLLGLVRPEGLAAAAVVALWAPWRARLTALALVAAPWVALHGYYGQWVPQSVVAKALTYGAHGPIAARHWYDWFIPFQFARWPQTAEGDNLLPLAVLFLPGLVAGLPALWRGRSPRLGALVAAGLSVLAGYSLVGVAYFNWYLLVPLMGVVVCASYGLALLRLPLYVWAAGLLFILGNWTLLPSLYRGRALIEQRLFRRSGEFIRLDAASHPSVVAGRKPLVFLEPIGWVGWQSGFKVADEVGLVTPWVAERRRQGPGWYADFVDRERPDYLLVRARMLSTGEAFAGAGAPFRSAEEHDRVFASYERVFPPAGEEVGPNDLVGLRRKRGSRPR